MSRLEAWLHGLERRLGRWGAALLVALGLMVLGALYVRPALEPVSHGVYYAQLSRAPFAPGDNPVAYRILTPLLAYLTGLRGNGILVVNLALAWLTLAVAYRHYHARGPLWACAYALILATSMPTLFTIDINGYTDAASYLLLLLLMVCGKNAVWFGLLLFLSLLNRESIAFMLPFLCLLQGKRGARLGASAAAAAFALAGYGGVRYWLGLHATGQQSMAFYFEPLLRDPFHWLRMASKGYYLGVFSAFKLFWLLPAGAVWLCIRRRRWLDAALMVGAVLCALAQTVIAVDTSRMACMAFPAVLLGLEVLEPEIVRLRQEPALAGLIGLNLLVPQVYVAGNAVYIMQTLLGHLLTR
jgi:hypothetical protein